MAHYHFVLVVRGLAKGDFAEVSQREWEVYHQLIPMPLDSTGYERFLRSTNRKIHTSKKARKSATSRQNHREKIISEKEVI